MIQRRALLGFVAAFAIAPVCVADVFEPPVPQPVADPAPFAASHAPVRYWPVVTTHERWRDISYQTGDGDFAGVELRRFNAPRPAAQAANPTRRHVGVDLFARPGDAVVAVEDGVIVAFYPFLRARAGEMSYALLVAHGGYVANYGEVREDSLRDRNLAIGDAIRAGQEIAEISDTAQLHFETYLAGTAHGQSWAHGAPRPARVLNPTRLLMELAVSGVRVQPGFLTATR